MAVGNPFYVHPGGDFGQGLSSLAGSVQQFGEQQKVQEQESKAEQRFKEVQGAMKQAMQSGDPEQMKQVAATYPEARESMELMFGFTNEQSKTAAKQTYRQVLADPENAEEYLMEGINRVSESGGKPSNMLSDLGMYRRDPEKAVRSMRMAYAGIDPEGYKAQFGDGKGGPDIGKFNPRDYTADSFSEFIKSKDPSVLERYASQRSVEIGGVPHVFDPARGGYYPARVSGASAPVTTETVAGSERQIAGAKERSKLEAQQDITPKIRGAIKDAESAAKNKGEALSEYDRAKAAQPGLREVVGKLKTLSDVATYTMGGKVFDNVVKELGFGATEGATARAKMESLVNNQILPLLRDTFGAQFTEKEGDSLKKTMLDIDAAPEQKRQILDSFIEQKMRDLEMKRIRADEGAATGQEAPKRIRLDAQGNIIQ